MCLDWGGMIEHPVGLRALVDHDQFWLNSQLSGIANSFYSVRATCVPSRYHICFCERMSPQTTNFIQKYILKWPLSPLPMRLIMFLVFLLLSLMVINLKQVLQLLTTPIRSLKPLEIILLPVPLLLLYIISFLNIPDLPHLLICPLQPLLPLLLFKGIHSPHNGFSSLYVF